MAKPLICKSKCAATVGNRLSQCAIPYNAQPGLLICSSAKTDTLCAPQILACRQSGLGSLRIKCPFSGNFEEGQKKMPDPRERPMELIKVPKLGRLPAAMGEE